MTDADDWSHGSLSGGESSTAAKTNEEQQQSVAARTRQRRCSSMYAKISSKDSALLVLDNDSSNNLELDRGPKIKIARKSNPTMEVDEVLSSDENSKDGDSSSYSSSLSFEIQKNEASEDRKRTKPSAQSRKGSIRKNTAAALTVKKVVAENHEHNDDLVDDPDDDLLESYHDSENDNVIVKEETQVAAAAKKQDTPVEKTKAAKKKRVMLEDWDAYDIRMPANINNNNNNGECTILVQIDPSDAAHLDFTGAVGVIGRFEADEERSELQTASR